MPATERARPRRAIEELRHAVMRDSLSGRQFIQGRMMPTIMRHEGYRVVVYPNDHGPAHVHVIGADNEAVFELNCPAGPPGLRGYHAFTFRELRRWSGFLPANITDLCARWSAIHG
jgi:hypothetical protein